MLTLWVLVQLVCAILVTGCALIGISLGVKEGISSMMEDPAILIAFILACIMLVVSVPSIIRFFSLLQVTL